MSLLDKSDCPLDGVLELEDIVHERRKASLYISVNPDYMQVGEMLTFPNVSSNGYCS